MSLADDEVEGQVHGWRLLAVLHARIESRLERALQTGHGLSVSEYGVLEMLSRQEQHHLRMTQLGTTMAMSQSATTRLVTRLEDRGLLTRYLCATDRRGIYSEVTDAGFAVLTEARPTHNRVLHEELAAAAENPEMAHLVAAISASEPAVTTGGPVRA
ncbi:MarR family winged helix-turn-helix transcriptional regulator [Pseudonocardia sp. HH130630-07]|uniref:MarR family winged helix-turn-helix transcriptional regulator n=1 Tax=Pseudonocardia sp. HH130630-07 TaxID=1690815 RepID=UPI0008151AD0|nr:MarR family transcriptional regulator [Pseudonocardia sp. HH130630-07]ANY08357.1 MarR family transcriptional regulator [Pseudonocardia sp. HH130630-07]